MKVASSALPSSAIIFFLIVADWRGLFTNKCVMYTHTTPTKGITALTVLHCIVCVRVFFGLKMTSFSLCLTEINCELFL